MRYSAVAVRDEIFTAYTSRKSWTICTCSITCLHVYRLLHISHWQIRTITYSNMREKTNADQIFTLQERVKNIKLQFSLSAAYHFYIWLFCTVEIDVASLPSTHKTICHRLVKMPNTWSLCCGRACWPQCSPTKARRGAPTHRCSRQQSVCERQFWSPTSTKRKSNLRYHQVKSPSEKRPKKH